MRTKLMRMPKRQGFQTMQRSAKNGKSAKLKGNRKCKESSKNAMNAKSL